MSDDAPSSPRTAADPVATAPAAALSLGVGATFGDYLELTKPRLSFLSVATALAGYVAARPVYNARLFVCFAVGTAMAAGGAAALNQWMESETDARMRRTADRPIPAGRVPGGSAFVLGWMLCIVSLALVYSQVNGLAALFTLLTIGCYLGIYTPAKRLSRWSTEIGAVAGALPPLIGWAAGAGHMAALGWVLFGILFFWQIPHFMALAWTYRADYAAVHFPMLPVRDASGVKVARWSLVAAIALVAVALLPTPLGLCGRAYAAATLLLGAWFVGRAIAFVRPEGRERSARRLFFASLGYLPLQLGLLLVDRVFLR